MVEEYKICSWVLFKCNASLSSRIITWMFPLLLLHLQPSLTTWPITSIILLLHILPLIITNSILTLISIDCQWNLRTRFPILERLPHLLTLVLLQSKHLLVLHTLLSAKVLLLLVRLFQPLMTHVPWPLFLSPLPACILWRFGSIPLTLLCKKASCWLFWWCNWLFLFVSLSQKAALVWPGTPDSGVHGKTAPVSLSAGTHLGASLVNTGQGGMGRAVSPNSGLVHWVSMMTDHHGHHGHHMPAPAHSGSHESVHYSMWNGGLDVSIKSRFCSQSVAFFISCQVYFAPLSWFYDFRQCILSPKSVFCWSLPHVFLPSFLPVSVPVSESFIIWLMVWGFGSGADSFSIYLHVTISVSFCWGKREKRLKWESQSWWSCWSSLHENDDDDFGHEVEGRLMHHKKEKWRSATETTDISFHACWFLIPFLCFLIFCPLTHFSLFFINNRAKWRRIIMHQWKVREFHSFPSRKE